MDKKFIYLICPVNEVTDVEKERLDKYVSAVRAQGHRVHYPHEVNQIDPLGTRILTEHRAAMHQVTDVHDWWSRHTRGSYFDMGMAFMAGKPIHMANLQDLCGVEFDAFGKFVFNLADNLDPAQTDESLAFEAWAYKRKYDLQHAEVLEYRFKERNTQFYFDFGMAFCTEKPFVLLNPDEVRKIAVLGEKSFQNVLLDLDAKFRTGKR